MEISEDVFWELSIATSGGPVCPKLQYLTWASDWGWESMQQFFSPYLVSVEFIGVRMERDYPVFTTTISLLPTTYLEDLTFTTVSPSTPIHSALSEVVQRLRPCFKQLTTESSLSDAAWEHLASLLKLD